MCRKSRRINKESRRKKAAEDEIQGILDVLEGWKTAGFRKYVFDREVETEIVRRKDKDWQPGYAIPEKKHEDFAFKVRDRLVKWVDQWLALKRNSEQLLNENSQISAAIDDFLKNRRPVFLASTSGQSWIEYSRELKAPVKGEAARLFLKILTSPRCRWINKCEACGRVYLQKTSRTQKRFCSRGCANAAWRLRPCYQRNKLAKIDKVRFAIEQWPAEPPIPQDPQKWLHEKTGLSMSWLTRRLKDGVIRIPQVRKRPRGRPRKV